MFMLKKALTLMLIITVTFASANQEDKLFSAVKELRRTSLCISPVLKTINEILKRPDLDLMNFEASRVRRRTGNKKSIYELLLKTYNKNSYTSRYSNYNASIREILNNLIRRHVPMTKKALIVAANSNLIPFLANQMALDIYFKLDYKLSCSIDKDAVQKAALESIKVLWKLDPNWKQWPNLERLIITKLDELDRKYWNFKS